MSNQKGFSPESSKVAKPPNEQWIERQREKERAEKIQQAVEAVHGAVKGKKKPTKAEQNIDPKEGLKAIAGLSPEKIQGG